MVCRTSKKRKSFCSDNIFKYSVQLPRSKCSLYLRPSSSAISDLRRQFFLNVLAIFDFPKAMVRFKAAKVSDLFVTKKAK